MKKDKTMKVEFDFSTGETILQALKSELELHSLSVLLVLSVLRALSNKNKKGVDVALLCRIICEITDIGNRLEFHILINTLSRIGFLLVKEYVDDDGDRSALIFLRNKEVGDKACDEILKKLPEFLNCIDNMSEVDLAEVGLDGQTKEPDKKEVKH